MNLIKLIISFLALARVAFAHNNLRHLDETPAVLFDETSAQGTPDDVPPAWETICEDASIGDKGAYGLCIAYCEAKDCDTKDSPPCSKPEENFKAITGAGMPCTATVCPCTEFTEWAEAFKDVNDGEVGACFRTVAPSFYVLKLDEDRPSPAVYVNQNLCGMIVQNTFIKTKSSISPEEAAECLSPITSTVADKELADCEEG